MKALIIGFALLVSGAGQVLAALSHYVPAATNVAYGTHPHQNIDVYLPVNGAAPYPVLIWFGGGTGLFKSGKKAPKASDLDRLLTNGCTVVNAQYRSLDDAINEKLGVPIAVSLSDARRVVQFVRFNANKWKLDPERMAVAGGSQGTLPSLYVACAGEKANPKAIDPVERVSTRVIAVGANRSQPSIDPKRMQEWVPGVEWGAPAFGCSFAESLKRREELLPIINEWSPDALLSRDTPPIYFEYDYSLHGKPDKVPEMGYKVHSPAWAIGFQKLARERGNHQVYVKCPEVEVEQYPSMWDFLLTKLHANPATLAKPGISH